jgi:hypothetical protein
MNNQKSTSGGTSDYHLDVKQAEVNRDSLALRCEEVTNQAVRPAYTCISCKKLAREHNNNCVKFCKAKGPDPQIYLQMLNDQNRKTAHWLRKLENLEKEAKQYKTNQEAQTAV